MHEKELKKRLTLFFKKTLVQKKNRLQENEDQPFVSLQ